MSARGSMVKKAKRFAASVQLGKTYYSVEAHATAARGRGWGPDEHFLHEWVFTKKHFLTGQPMCGHMSAVAVFYYTDGLITDKRPRGYRTVSEQSKLNQESTIPLEGYDPPTGWAFKEGSDAEDLWDDYQEWLKTRGKRR